VLPGSEWSEMSVMDERIRQCLRCPACGGILEDGDARLTCGSATCGRVYPVIGGTPVLIDEERSLLRLEDYRKAGDRALKAVAGREARSPLRRLARGIYRRLPSITSNLSARENYRRFAGLLRERSPEPLVLVVGGREVGRGMDDLLAEPDIRFIETDIDFGERTRIVCDAHQLPFGTGAVDGVVVQAVLEHVLDPHRCVAEIHRVLGPGGLVYAETPFLQRRHGGPFDFTRFTFLGHRRLFRRFEEIDSGAAGGPGSALAMVYTGYLLTLSRRRAIQGALRIFGILTSFWLKYLDRRLCRDDAALDVASGFAFLGRRSEAPLDDRELIRSYRGLS
jgi:SAM-dependent methyltransferase